MFGILEVGSAQKVETINEVSSQVLHPSQKIISNYD